MRSRRSAQALDALVAKRIEGYDLHLIIVESNSTDGSSGGGPGYRGRPGNVTVILEDTPAGKGHAVRAGLAAATGDIVMIQDADLEYDLERLCEAPGAHRGGDPCALSSAPGTPRAPGPCGNLRTNGGGPFVLNVAHWTFTLMINASLGIWLNDPFTMYKVFRRDCIQGLKLECNRFDFDWELLIKLSARATAR
jgi:glycosyltransferase involved in cell wall biosynthesis